MFVKESAKCSLQLANSSDAFPLRDSLSLSVSSQLSLAPFGRDTQIVTCLSGSAETRQIETHLAVELEEWWHATSDCVG